MHGLGDSGMGWADAFANYCADPNVRYIFPSAKEMPVTLNMGMNMPSWFDIKELSASASDRYDLGKVKQEFGLNFRSFLPENLTDYDRNRAESNRILAESSRTQIEPKPNKVVPISNQ